MKFDRHRGRSRGPFVPADPDLFFGSGRHDKPEHHTAALCKQVQRALTYILAGEVADENIQSLMVLAVTPAPNAGRLLVTLGSRGPFDLSDLLTRLDALSGFLRTRVAESITRKRAPELTFMVVPLAALRADESEADHDC